METTEKPMEPQKIANKKRGTATVKKTPKRLKGNGPSKSAKTKKQSDTASTTQEEPAGGSDHDHNVEELDESDNGPYCICRGPDDHRFMIACDICEDWFHGECIDIAKDVGENLIHRFVCPNCRDESKQIVSIFKLKCSYPTCKKAIRKDPGTGQATAFCSEEHSQMWWEMMIAAAPKPKRKAKDPRELEGQSELIAVLNSSLAGVGPDGKFRISTKPFTTPATGDESSDTKGKALAPGILTEEEEAILKASAADRYSMGEQTVLCTKMLQLLDMANDRRKELIAAKQLEDAACGYDFRLDQVGVVGPFAHWLETDESAKKIFKTGKLDAGSRLTGDDRNICDKKRCKTHSGWFSMHTRDVKHLQKLLADDANKMLERERLIKDAAVERKLRKEAEHSTVRSFLEDGSIGPAEVM
ncbi:PHD-finger domain-containing protein [Colletotrichum camelliae]|nr:PHD-finger domain-containing protein [Colletotrichum camelliae]